MKGRGRSSTDVDARLFLGFKIISEIVCYVSARTEWGLRAGRF